MNKNKIKKLIKNNRFSILLILLSIFLIGSFIILLGIQYSVKLTSPEESKSFIKYLDIYTLISTIAVIIGTVIAIIELRGNNKINEADFIKDLNKQFITNEEMVEVEHALETYNNKYFLGEENIVLDLDIRLDGKDRQKLVNYLVYLEGLASIIEQGVLHINTINSLFGYRFFLAVNNPIVQNIELYPFSTYYQGIFSVYEDWIDKCKDKNSSLFMQVPLNDYKLNTKMRLAYNRRVRRATIKDDLKEIASLIYDTDDNIYQTLFIDRKNAIETLTKLIALPTGFFSYKNIMVLTERIKNGEEKHDIILGALLYNDGQTQFLWNEKQMAKYIKTDHDKFKDVSKRYFNKYSKNRTDSIEIVAVCVNEKYRSTDKIRRYCGFFLLNQFATLYCDKKLTLEVLETKNNTISLYEKYLFFKKENYYPGYSYQKKPVSVYKMTRHPLCNANSNKTKNH